MANAFNSVTIIGRIPESEKIPFRFVEKDDPKSNFASFMVSVRRGYKAKGSQYEEEDLIPVKTFGHNATFIGTYGKRGDMVAVNGEIRREDDWEDSNGETHRGGYTIQADSVRIVSSKNGNSNKGSNETANESSAPKSNSQTNNKLSLAAKLRNKRAGLSI